MVRERREGREVRGGRRDADAPPSSEHGQAQRMGRSSRCSRALAETPDAVSTMFATARSGSPVEPRHPAMPGVPVSVRDGLLARTESVGCQRLIGRTDPIRVRRRAVRLVHAPLGPHGHRRAFPVGKGARIDRPCADDAVAACINPESGPGPLIDEGLRDNQPSFELLTPLMRYDIEGVDDLDAGAGSGTCCSRRRRHSRSAPRRSRAAWRALRIGLPSRLIADIR